MEDLGGVGVLQRGLAVRPGGAVVIGAGNLVG
jgi:hypothetical protein